MDPAHVSASGACRHCGGDPRGSDHLTRCDGRQGGLDGLSGEAEALEQIITDPAGDDDPRGGTLAERAARFHAQNPAVYRFAVSISRYVKRSGVEHYGIGAIWEVMRFKYLETHGDLYKLNNNHRAWYARLIMAQEPDLAGFFSTRETAHDDTYQTREVA
jgi:hypothetical protein